MWPEIAELRGTHWHDTLMARRGMAITPASVDSTYRGNEVRVFQHILFAVRPNSTPEEKSVARKKAESVLGQLRGGADFGKLASTNSADPGSARDSGFLPPSPKGVFVPTFDSAGWALPPGGMTSLVETSYGYHIIKRPSAEAVRGRLTSWMQQSIGARLDSLYMDSLGIRAKLAVPNDAPKLMRLALDTPDEYAKSSKKITQFSGGGLTAAEFVRWIRALPPQLVGQLRQSPDDGLRDFAKLLSNNVLLLRQADSAKIQITPEEWQGIFQRYRGQVDTLSTEMGLNLVDVRDTAVATKDRQKVAALKVDQYFDKLLTGQVRLRALPTTLGADLREHARYGINEGGINRSLELARAKQAQDSTAKPSQMPPGAMQPAPGPAPVPGGAPAQPEQGTGGNK
jgi:hypothetical protein